MSTLKLTFFKLLATSIVSCYEVIYIVHLGELGIVYKSLIELPLGEFSLVCD